MHASTFTSAPAAGWSCARSQATAACFVPTVRFPVPRSRPTHHVARLRRVGSWGSVKAPRTDWASGVRGCLIWGIPAALLIMSPVQYFVIVWPAALTFMGLACLLNARRCGRVHCFVTGPFFLLLALVGLLYGLGVLPLGARGWSMLSIGLVVGSVVLICVPEWLFGRYRASATGDC